ncbi:MAG: hypothetical protein M1269_03910 [Chloroflexi bacterium]|nr:hypothetical protein [Chloroflexota bacterium]
MDNNQIRQTGNQRMFEGIIDNIWPKAPPVPKDSELKNTIKEIKDQADLYKPSPEKPELMPGKNVRSLKGYWNRTNAIFRPDEESLGQRVSVPDQWALDNAKLFNKGGSFWYSKKFVITPDMVKDDKLLKLKFEGVDYKTDVYLNKEKIGDHEGYFSPFEYDITDKVKPGEKNLLQVKVNAPDDLNPFFKNNVKGILAQHDCRPGGKTSPASAGSTGGIWGDVQLESTGRETIENVQVTTDLSKDHKQAEVAFNYLLCNHDGETKKQIIELKIAPKGSKDPKDCTIIRKEIELKPGFNQVSLKSIETDPKLWWTWDQGKPNLYEGETKLYEENQKDVSDSNKTTFGIRKLEFDQKTGILKLNDRKIFQKGTNYIPTQWFSTYNAERYGDDIKLMQEQNLNAARVHAMVLPHEFYQKADEMGMLVWADFPLIWGQSITPGFMDKAKQQYAQFIETYRNHPSIWMWCAHNEPLPTNLPLDMVLNKIPEKLDPTRPHTRDSAFYTHFYPGWYDVYGGDYKDINRYKAKEVTEYGAQGVPLSVKDFIPKKDQWPINDEKWRYFDFQPKETYKHIGDKSAFKSLDDFIDTSQKYQYDYNKYVTEFFRRNKYNPTGMIYPFMFKESWPGITWAVVDHENKPKMAFQALKDAMNPVLLSIEWRENKFEPGQKVSAPLWLVNDKSDKINDCRLTWKLTPADNPKKALEKGNYKVDLDADSSRKIKNVKFKIPDEAKPGENWILRAELRNSEGELLSKNAYMFGTHKPQEGPFRYEPAYPADEYPAAG